MGLFKQMRGKNRSLAVAALISGILLLYVLFLTRTYYWDGVLFSLYIEGVHAGNLPAAILFHPNHLLYSVVGYSLYAAARAGGLAVRALLILQLFNVFLSVCASYVFFL